MKLDQQYINSKNSLPKAFLVKSIYQKDKAGENAPYVLMHFAGFFVNCYL